MWLFTRALKCTLLGSLLLLAATQSMAFTPPAGITQITSVEGITEYTLEANGLRILLAPDDSKPTTTVNMTYLVGSRYENYGETGMVKVVGTPAHNAGAQSIKCVSEQQ